MKQYLNLLGQIMTQGIDKENRTGCDARSTFGLTFEHDMQTGFPLITTKKMAWKMIVGELIGFLRGYSSAADFRDLNCSIWDANANENKAWLKNPNRTGNDDLGRIYGVQWRNWISIDQQGQIKRTDQLKTLIHNIIANPNDRRLIVSAWNPGELSEMALPPCHMFFQCWYNPENNGLSLQMYQRSCDFFLGVPFNIASYGLLLEILAKLTDTVPDKLKLIFGDSHIYQNHFDQVKLQMERDPLPLPTLSFKRNFTLDSLQTEDIILNGYDHYSSIKGDMSV